MTTWYILRHADKETGNYFNPDLRHQDEPISQKGRRDSQKLCDFFSTRQIEAIYVSAYRRTWQTIEAVAGELRLTPTVDPRLNEIDNGKLEGMTDVQILQEYPAVWEAYNARTADFRFPEGESGVEARQRIASFTTEKLVQHGAGDIIVVCHEGLIRLWMCYLMHLPVYLRGNFRVDTCGIMEITYQPRYESWKLIRFNHTL
jgi:probable phosphoglycerate mutase